MQGLKWRRNGFALLSVMLAMLVAVLAGCGQQPGAGAQNSGSASGEKQFVYGTTGYGVQMDDTGLNPHSAYSGWSAVRYGVGETLFKFNDAMEAEPWLATSFEQLDDTHMKIVLRDGVKFSSGRAMDGQAVKECLDDLIAKHDRAPADMKISAVTAEGNTVTIETAEPCPALVNYLCDPYGAIIDMKAGVTQDNNVSGTGPYVAETVTDTQIVLHKNASYWGEDPKVDTVIVRAFTDTDALQSALQSGEIDASYGLAYASYPLFQNDRYQIADCFTSRVFFGQFNYASPAMQDAAVRRAVSMGIDKQGFVKTLLNGRGEPAKGPFPASLRFGDNTVHADAYDAQAAKGLLEQAGWVDANGDGIREKDGQRLTLRWLTYPGRLELPLLAEAAQASLRELGIDVQVNSTANHTDLRKDKGAWDVYVSALTTAPTGDPEYFFAATCRSDSSKNFGGYANATLDALAEQLHVTFGADERAKLATQMSQAILDDHGYFFVSFLQMGIVSKANVKGMAAHPCDYYEITTALDV